MADESTKIFQSESNEERTENNGKARKIATAAGVAAGAMGVGGAAGYAATLGDDEPATQETPAAPEPPVTPEPQPEPEPRVVERVVVREVQAPAPPQPQHHEDNNITYDIDSADVQVIEVGQTGEGGYYATAQIDGHAAVYVDADGDGKVDVLGIDVNNDGQLQNNEIMDVSDRNVSMHDLAAAANNEPRPTPASDPEPEIRVTDVEHNVNIEGETVDVASIEYNGHAGMAIDIDQDGYADVAAIDLNDNGSIEENERFRVNEGDIRMSSGQPAPGPRPAANHDEQAVDPSEIQVGAVDENVETEHGTVNMAEVEYRGHAGVAIDADQDGYADAVGIDLNDNGHLESNEIFNAEGAGIAMRGSGAIAASDPEPDPAPCPGEPDPYSGDPYDPIASTDGLPDYTNEGDIGGYVI